MFQWGNGQIVAITLKVLDTSSTIIEVTEEGFKENDEDLIYF
ncbi:hypothetical protein [Bacillus methanolicus]|nr:hypothetical protein [Bacillus methanolicus]EIJ82574.1 hypothetical protein MGA3_05035 [Bacillus methanolicus MGA3]